MSYKYYAYYFIERAGQLYKQSKIDIKEVVFQREPIASHDQGGSPKIQPWTTTILQYVKIKNLWQQVKHYIEWNANSMNRQASSVPRWSLLLHWTAVVSLRSKYLKHHYCLGT